MPRKRPPGAPPKKPRATDLVYEARLAEVIAIRLDGAEFWDLREYAREKQKEEGSPWFLPEGTPPFNDNHLRRYLAAADKTIRESVKIDREVMLKEHVARRRRLYGAAVTQGDLRTALAIDADVAKLCDLYPDTKHRHVGADGKSAIAVAFIEIPTDGTPESAPSDPASDPSGQDGTEV